MTRVTDAWQIAKRWPVTTAILSSKNESAFHCFYLISSAVSSRAEQEHLAALSWYRERSLIAATNLENAISKALRTIAKAPQRLLTYVKNFRKVQPAPISFQHNLPGVGI